ncbi:MAG: hypothetical protein HYZ50_02145 [Deltaproteobacteria bacterium]|nr:hypothetical protein [Deltaproteobacteria bacterium]
MTLMEFSRTFSQFGSWGMVLKLASSGIDLHLTDFLSNKVGRTVEDWDMPEVRIALQFRCPSRKYAPDLG